MRDFDFVRPGLPIDLGTGRLGSCGARVALAPRSSTPRSLPSTRAKNSRTGRPQVAYVMPSRWPHTTPTNRPRRVEHAAAAVARPHRAADRQRRIRRAAAVACPRRCRSRSGTGPSGPKPQADRMPGRFVIHRRRAARRRADESKARQIVRSIALDKPRRESLAARKRDDDVRRRAIEQVRAREHEPVDSLRSHQRAAARAAIATLIRQWADAVAIDCSRVATPDRGCPSRPRSRLPSKF